MRKVLQMLSEEGLIERTKRKGTSVLKRKVQIPITLLIPCSNYLNNYTFSTCSLSEVLHGVISNASARNMRVETVAVSVNNDPDNIDWDTLDFVNCESRIVIYGTWYQKIFQFLLERRCRVALAHTGTTPNFLKPVESGDWDIFLLDSYSAGFKAAEHLIGGGCRRIAIASPGETWHPFVAGCRNALSKYGLKFFPELLIGDLDTVGDVQKEAPFDGLLMDNLRFAPGFYYEFLNRWKLKPGTMLVARYDHPAFGEISSDIAAMNFDFSSLGHDMVTSVLDDNRGKKYRRTPEVKIYKANRHHSTKYKIASEAKDYEFMLNL